MIKEIHKVDVSVIKLIIWDLDNTFWEGTISEGEIIPVQQNIDLVKDFSSHGVVNSICSKNDFETCRKKLQELGIWDYFVFPSIDWTPKAQRLHGIIKDMGLRPANVLFLDDEPYNLQAAKAVDDRLMCGTIQDLYDSIYSQLPELPIQPDLKRLRQYQDLQQKLIAKKEFDSDEEFLRSSEIKVRLLKDCGNQIERITELINRTNQLNYTKKRISQDEVSDLITNSGYECACVSVSDKFCDYGITGFYALEKANARLEHFLFSCRTIGMGVEQFVYALLHYPSLEVKGDVVNKLSNAPKPYWITLVTNPTMDDGIREKQLSEKILFKGPCDVSQVLPFFKNSEMFDAEFSYTSTQKKGTYIESMNHSSQILMCNEIDDETKEQLVRDIPFIDEEYFDTKIFSRDYDYIILSMLTDYSLGLYRCKNNPKIILPFNQYTIDYTKWANWNEIMHEQTINSDEQIKKDYEFFCRNFEFAGRISDNQFLQNLETIRKRLPKQTKLILLNGAEQSFPGKCKKGYENREQLHLHLNPLVSDFVAKHPANCYVINTTELLQSNNPYLDTINHYKKAVYYRIATSIQDYIVSHNKDAIIEVRGEQAILVDRIKYYYSQLKGWGYQIYTRMRNEK